MLEKKFEVNQQAYSNIEKFKNLIHLKDEEIFEKVNEGQVWFNDHNLFLEPTTRKLFIKAINEVNFYNIQLEDYKDTGKSEGWESSNTVRKKRDIGDTFKNITHGIQDRIQDDIGQYYKYLK